MVRFSTVFVLSSCLCLAGLACTQSAATEPSGSGGSAGNGGSSKTGGSTGNGGTSNNGGTTSSGGTASAGGSAGSAGKGGRGGTTSSGGTSASGGKGGTSSAGGSTGRGGSAGAAGSGGTTSAGGSAGNGGSGGAAGNGGTATSGGSIGNGGAAGSGTSSCTFTQSSSLSTKIATVGIVKWSTTLSGLTSARIEFGLDTNYGMTAPIDKPATGENTTLLLGMKQSKTYHYRITATGSGGDCKSSDYTIATTTLPSGLPKMTVTTKNKTALFGGYLIAGQYLQSGGGSPSYILDADGDMVWSFSVGNGVTGAVMNYAGTHLWINSANVPSGQASVHRVSMDGLKDEDLSSKFTGLNHQLTVLPDETVAYFAYNSSTGCDDIKEYSPTTGTSKTIANSGTAQGGASSCHVNNIQYSKDDDCLVFSELKNQVVVKVKRSDGSAVWVLNGSKSTMTGDTWKGGQHGIHVLGPDRFMLFNNNSRSYSGDGSGSIAAEFKLDLTGKKFTKAWSYKAAGIQNDVMGDVQRLSNGNTVVAYSTQGVLHEVDASGALLQELEWPIGASYGYIQKRATLYGPPPR